MNRHEICAAFTQRVVAVVGRSDAHLTAEELTMIDDWWMPLLFKLREEALVRKLAGRDGEAKGVSA